MKLQSKPSGTSRYLEVAPIFNFLNANDFLGQDQTHINSHFDLDNFYQKGCTLPSILLYMFIMQNFVNFHVKSSFAAINRDFRSTK